MAEAQKKSIFHTWREHYTKLMDIDIGEGEYGMDDACLLETDTYGGVLRVVAKLMSHALAAIIRFECEQRLRETRTH